MMITQEYGAIGAGDAPAFVWEGENTNYQPK